MKEKETEQHPHFPSGQWEGFYTYKNLPGEKGQMYTILNFQGGAITGSGSDPVGAFTWRGSYDPEKTTCRIEKEYTGSHVVYYKGVADENGIYGTWTINKWLSGEFHLWSRKNNTESQGQEAKKEEKTLEKPLDLIMGL